MILFFVILAVIATLIVYSIIQASLVLFIGFGVAGGLILSSIYWELKTNFYIQSAFIFVNSIVQLILLVTIPDHYNGGALWIIYTILIFSWMRDWIVHFDAYHQAKYMKAYWRVATRGGGSGKVLDKSAYDEFLEGLDALQTIKYYLICTPYLIFNLLALMAYANDFPDVAFLPYVSPIIILICIVIFLINFKIKGIDPTEGALDTIKSFGDIFRVIGGWFKNLFSGLCDFFGSIVSFFIEARLRKPRSSYSSKAPKKKQPKVKQYTSSYTKPRRERTVHIRSYSSSHGDFSALNLILPIAFCAVCVIFLVLENSSLISGQVGSWSNGIFKFVFDESQWFVLTGMVWENCLMELNTDTLLNLITFIPLVILTLALLVVVVALELVLSIVYGILGVAVGVVVAILSFILAFIPGLLAAATVVVAVITFKKNNALANKIASSLLVCANIAVCVYYFVVLFSHQA